MALKPANRQFERLIHQIAGERFSSFIDAYLIWKPVVGELLAERSHPIKLERDILFVGVQNSSWLQELTLLKPEIIAKYDKRMEGKVKDIIFLIQTQKRDAK